VGDLAGKTAIITGGGQGVGRGIALALAAEGAQVVVCGRRQAPLDGVCDEIGALGVPSLAVPCDVTNSADLARLVAETIERFGTVDILVNNAALVPHGSMLELDEATIEAAWTSGPLAALRLMRLCYDQLKGDGVVINISSGAAVASSVPNRGMYAATKAALNAISRSAATEWGPVGIRVNVVMPLARTEAVDRLFLEEPAYAAAILNGVPLGRLGDATADIGHAVAFLVSPKAAYITGVILPVDGGTAYIR